MVGQKLGKVELDHYLRAFGFGKKTDVGFPGEPAGLLLDPDHWYVTSMGTVPIGNGLAVSALQMLQVYTTVANGGMYQPPRAGRGDHRRRRRPPPGRRRRNPAG